MGTVLVAITDDIVEESLFRAAKRYISGTNDEIISYWIVDEKEHQAEVQQKARSGKLDESAKEALRPTDEKHDRIAAEIYGEDVTYTTVTEFGTSPDDVLAKASEYGSEHLFVTGRKRSPTGKVLFGDAAQQLILNFDGLVTVNTVKS